MHGRRNCRPSAGFSFIEILVVMGIIAVLTSMVVLLVPKGLDTRDRLVSQQNVRQIVTLMLSRRTARADAGWPAYGGKQFVLSLVATNQIDRRNPQNLEVLFSPSDVLYRPDGVSRERWAEVTRSALAAGTDFRELTSYAGRRNTEREYLVTPSQEKAGTLIVCDDDDGPLHHAEGLVAGYTSGAVRFLEWADLEMEPPVNPDDPVPFLGDDATHPELKKVRGR